MRTSEIIVPEDMHEVFFVRCSEYNTEVGPLTETGCWNVLMVSSMDKAAGNEFACPGEHTQVTRSIG